MAKTGPKASAVTPAGAMTALPAAPAGGAERNRGKVKAVPVMVYMHDGSGAPEWLDAHMIYALPDGRWLFVSEDRLDVYIYSSLRELLVEQRELDVASVDVVVAGWDMEPFRAVR